MEIIGITPEKTVSFRCIEGFIMLDAEIDGEKGQVVLDTGATLTILNSRIFTPPPFAEGVSIVNYSGSLGENTAKKAGILSEIKLCCGISIRNIDVMTAEYGYIDEPLEALHPEVRFLGVLGLDILNGLSFIIDYDAEKITFEPEHVFAGNAEAIYGDEKILLIPAKIGEKSYRFILDTGANICIIDKTVAETAELKDTDELMGAKILPEIEIAEILYEVYTMVSDFSCTDPSYEIKGVVGFQFLSHQRTFIDLKHHVMILEADGEED